MTFKRYKSSKLIIGCIIHRTGRSFLEYRYPKSEGARSGYKFKSLKTLDFKEAEKLAVRYEKILRKEDTLDFDYNTLTFNDLIKDFMKHARKHHSETTYASNRSRTRTIAKYLGKKLVCEISPSLIEDARDKYLDTGIKNRTANHFLKVTRRIFSLALNKDKIDNNPAARVELLKAEPTEINPFTPEDLIKIIDTAVEIKNKVMFTAEFFLLSVTTGLRMGNIRKLKWSELNLDDGVITLLKVKNNKQLKFNLYPEVVGQLLALKFKCNQMSIHSEFVFYGRKPDQAISKSWVEKNWENILKTAGIEYRSFHTLRHTFVTSGREEGISYDDLRKFTGHKTREAFDMYEHMRITRIKEISEQMIYPDVLSKTKLNKKTDDLNVTKNIKNRNMTGHEKSK